MTWRNVNLQKACATVLGVLALSGTLASAQSTKAIASSKPLLEGSWRIQVSLKDCDTGVALGSPFNSFSTFARGGTVVDSAANPMFFPAVRSTGHGVWKRTGWRAYSTSSIAFLTVNGALVKTQVITQKIKFGDNPDGYWSDATVQFFDPAGTVVASACASATAQRFE
jgi:hypothetical protein